MTSRLVRSAILIGGVAIASCGNPASSPADSSVTPLAETSVLARGTMSSPYGTGCYSLVERTTSEVVRPEHCVTDSASSADMLFGGSIDLATRQTVIVIWMNTGVEITASEWPYSRDTSGWTVFEAPALANEVNFGVRSEAGEFNCSVVTTIDCRAASPS